MLGDARAEKVDDGWERDHAPARRAPKLSVASERIALDSVCLCPNCGTAVDPYETSAIKRGALVVTREPCTVTWRGQPVKLSPTEALIFATIAARGRASFAAIDAMLRDFGANPNGRAVLMLRIRRKFIALGASDPFERIGNAGVRLVVDPDEDSSRATVIGLRATVTASGGHTVSPR